MKKKNLLILLWLLCTAVQAASLVIIPLQHRSADEMLPQVQPLLGDDEGVSGRGFEIYLRARPETVQAVRDLLARLDQPVVQLKIFVRGIQTDSTESAAIAAHGSIGSAYNRQNISIDVHDSSTLQTQHVEPFVRTTEGQPAWIGSGIDVPVALKNFRRDNGRLLETDTTTFIQARSGFYVTVWLRGEQLTLDIRAQRQAMQSGGAIDTSAVNTTATGKLGEWIEIGGLQQNETRNERHLIGGSRSTTVQRGGIYVKVEKAD